MSFNRNRASTRAPNDIGNRVSSQGTERINEAQIIRRLEQEEKETNAFIMSASGFSFGAAWLIVRNVQDLRARVAQKIGHHLTAMLSRASQRNSLVSPPVAIPPAPDPVLSPSGSCLRRAIFYWLIGLLFCLFALFVAILVKQKIRGHRLVLQSHSQPWEKAEVQESLYGDAWYVETDTMYQLFQVSLAILILGHINFFLFPVGPTIFAATVVLGLLYVFGGS